MHTPAKSVFVLLVIYLAFVSLGLPDGTLGVAWPRMHPELGLPIGLAGLVAFSVTLFSGLSSFGSGRIIARWGTGPVVLASGIATGLALLGYAQAPNLGWLLAASVPLGLGAGAVDAGLNGFVARHYSGRHMNWLHACWGVGASAGPLIMAQALGSGNSWRGGYLVIAGIQLGLAGLFLVALPFWKHAPTARPPQSNPTSPHPPAPGSASLAAWISCLIFTLYVAAEGTAGLWLATILTESRSVPADVAGRWVTVYYGAITVGRILAGFASHRIGNRAAVKSGLWLALLGVAIFAAFDGPLAMLIALMLMGLGFAPVYPGLMHEVPRRFAPAAVQTVIGRQVSGAYVGMALFPPLAGAVAQVSPEGITYTLIGAIGALAGLVAWLDRLTPKPPATPLG